MKMCSVIFCTSPATRNVMFSLQLLFHLSMIFVLCVHEIKSISVVRNVTVSSDVLSEVFIREIKNNQNKTYATSESDFGSYNSNRCLKTLREIVIRYPNSKVSRFLDAWGRLPSGMESGNEYDLGNYDQCIGTSVTLDETVGVVNSQYCFVTIRLKEKLTPNNRWDVDPTSNTGMCVPDSCSPDLLSLIFKESVSGQFEGALSSISVGRCSNGKIPPLTTINIIGISVFGIVTVLMVLSSIYDFTTSKFNKKPFQILLAFSVFANAKKLFAIRTKRSKHSIDCLTGMRVLSILWIMNHHVFINIFGTPIINSRDRTVCRPEFFPVLNASISVDTFLFMGGLLVAWKGFRRLDKTSGKINPTRNIVHRYFRLTPILAAGLLMAYCLNKIIYIGPVKDVQIQKNGCDASNWWPILLYIQNYYFQERICYIETWYLAVDFQLYALSPLLLVPMWKCGKKFAPILVVLALASIGCVMGIYFSEGYVGLVLDGNPHEFEKVYTPTHTRCVTWLLGLGFGYFLHKNQGTNFQISRIVQLVAWILCFFTISAIVFGPYFTLTANGHGTVFEAAMYESLKRISWGLAHAWITFACYYGYGGFVDTFLSHPFWQPFGRLSYAMYMMHMAVERMHFGLTRTEVYFSVYNQFLYFWSAFGTTLFVSIYVTLAFESPLIHFEKFLFDGERGSLKSKPVEKTSVSLTPNIVDDQPLRILEIN